MLSSISATEELLMLESQWANETESKAINLELEKVPLPLQPNINLDFYFRKIVENW